MRVETNERLVKRNRQIAQYLFFLTFAILIGGLFIINTQAANSDGSNLNLIAILQVLLLPVAFISTIVSVRMTNLWVRTPRPENVIREGLKGISNRSVLYNYFHIPARHVLICPQGVFVMVTRYHEGRFEVKDNRWRSRKSAIGQLLGVLRFDGLGDPTYDAQRAVQHVKKLLAPIASDVDVQPLILFTDPRTTVEVVSSSIPVITVNAKKALPLKDVLKGYGGAKSVDPLTPDQIAEFEAATLRR